MALAISSPMFSSELAEIEPTWAISFEVEQGLDSFLSSDTASITALSMPRLRSIGFMPAATAFMPSRISACASTVAVVVPSPAMSEVLEATSFTIWAPMFSNLSASSISLATTDAVLGDRGGAEALVEHDVAALRAQGCLDGIGEDVHALHHAGAGVFTETNFLGSHFFNSRIFSGGVAVPVAQARTGGRSAQDGQDVVFLDHQDLVAVDLHFGAGVLAE